MLLNQLRCEEGDPENLLRNSFFQFQADRAIPDLEVQLQNAMLNVRFPDDIVFTLCI